MWFGPAFVGTVTVISCYPQVHPIQLLVWGMLYSFFYLLHMDLGLFVVYWTSCLWVAWGITLLVCWLHGVLHFLFVDCVSVARLGSGFAQLPPNILKKKAAFPRRLLTVLVVPAKCTCPFPVLLLVLSERFAKSEGGPSYLCV